MNVATTAGDLISAKTKKISASKEKVGDLSCLGRKGMSVETKHDHE